MSLYTKTIKDLHNELVQKKISSVELTKSVLARMEEVEPKIKAYITTTPDLALAAAEQVDKKIYAGEKISLLAGIPLAVKDNICTLNLKTTCASKMLENFRPPYNATVMDKLNSESIVLMGKTNLDEFAMGGSTEASAFHVTHNPWNLNAVPGGSSGGSAAAVASGSAIWALGSDTGGSVRQPASFTGTVGLKPTYGRVSRYGLVAYASSLDQIGPITRNVTDSAIALNAISGYDNMDSTSANIAVPDFTKALTGDIKGLKVGIPKEYFAQGLDAEVATVIKKAISQLEQLGAEIIEVSLPHTEHAVSTYYIIAPAEASSNLARYDGVGYGYRSENAPNLIEMTTNSRSEAFGEEVRRRIMLGTYVLSSGYYDAYYLKALKARTLIKQDFDNVFSRVDVVVAPASPIVAHNIGEITDPLASYMLDIYTVPVNLAGLPGISVPCGFAHNMPVGLQIIGKPLAEETILRVAYAYEQTQEFHKNMAAIGGR